MPSPIDPTRRAAIPRRAQQSEPDAVSDDAGEGEAATNLPVPVGVARTIRQSPPSQPGILSAQLIGQEGQKRGLRGGATVIESAKSSYNRIEWSGSKDRRAKSGRITKTEI